MNRPDAPGDGDAPPPGLDARFSLTVGQGATRFDLEARLHLDRGLLVLFGPSGSGKSLTLAALAGHITPQEGRISLRGESLFDGATGANTPARNRTISLVPQHNSLFPFRDVRGNVAFGLPRHRRRGKDDAVEHLMEALGISHLAKSSPGSLSGGERQRVALARALAVRPRLLLLDEPFASIDEAGRCVLQDILKDILKEHEIPAVFVTHDINEARRMGQQIVLFERGRTVVQGAPDEVLGAHGTITVTGQVSNSATEAKGAAEGGQTTAQLSSATITGPAHILQADDEGRVCIEAELPNSD